MGHRTTNHDIRAMRECAALGMSRAAAAKQIGMSPAQVSSYARREHIDFAIKGRGRMADHPAPDIMAVFRLHQTMQKIRVDPAELRRVAGQGHHTPAELFWLLRLAAAIIS